MVLALSEAHKVIGKYTALALSKGHIVTVKRMGLAVSRQIATKPCKIHGFGFIGAQKHSKILGFGLIKVRQLG